MTNRTELLLVVVAAVAAAGVFDFANRTDPPTAQSQDCPLGDESICPACPDAVREPVVKFEGGEVRLDNSANW